MHTIIITYTSGNTESIGILYPDADAIFDMYRLRAGITKVELFGPDNVSIKYAYPGKVIA